jgi:hypothetical protein
MAPQAPRRMSPHGSSQHLVAAGDGDHQVILAVGLSNQPPDVEPLEPMLTRTTGMRTTRRSASRHRPMPASPQAARNTANATGPERLHPQHLDAKERSARKLRTKKGV